MGKFDPAKDERFSKIPAPYAKKEMFMRIEALESFKKMHAAAKEDGISLLIISATRPFDVQKSIWEAKWTGMRKVDGKMLSKEVKESTDLGALKKNGLLSGTVPATSTRYS